MAVVPANLSRPCPNLSDSRHLLNATVFQRYHGFPDYPIQPPSPSIDPRLQQWLHPACLCRYVPSSNVRLHLMPVSAPVAGDPKDSKTGLGVTSVIPTEADQATGLERKEILEHLKGNTVRTSISSAIVFFVFYYSASSCCP